MLRGAVTLPGGGRARLAEFFRDGTFVLLDRSAPMSSEGPGGASNGVSASEVAGRVTIVPYGATTAPRLPATVLVRPDGYVAWASDEPDPAARAAATRAAIHLWCCPGVLAGPG
jgi:aromatic ring hydroxylase-like protein